MPLGEKGWGNPQSGGSIWYSYLKAISHLVAAISEALTCLHWEGICAETLLANEQDGHALYKPVPPRGSSAWQAEAVCLPCILQASST